MSKHTTLVTFRLELPYTVLSVEILGSWDNFERPYKLSRDKSAGAGQWQGCPRFDNITCDGDLADVSVKRQGCLKMGGLYWYYYRLNGDAEYCDPKEPSTTFCPSLPGQSMNVLEIPAQTRALRPCSPNGSTTSIDSLVFTLDPEDKYIPLGVRRVFTTSEIRKRRGLPFQGARIGISNPLSHESCPDERFDTATSSNCGAPLQRQCFDRSVSVISRNRRTKSAGSAIKANSKVNPGSSWSRKLFSRGRQSKKESIQQHLIPAVPKLPDQMPLVELSKQRPCSPRNFFHKRSKSDKPEPVQPPPALAVKSTSDPSLPPLDQPVSVESTRGSHDGRDQRPLSSRDVEASHTGILPNCPMRVQISTPAQSSDPLYRIVQNGLDTVECSAQPSQVDQGCAPMPESRESLNKHTDTRGDHPGSTSHDHLVSTLHDTDKHHSYAESSALSYTPSDMFSAQLGSNTTTSGYISSIHLSPPSTPQTQAFDDKAVPTQQDPSSPGLHTDYADLEGPENGLEAGDSPRRPHSECGHSGFGSPNFAGYSQDQSSTVTLRKLPSLDFQPHVDHRTSTQQLVHSWDDGGEPRMNALVEMYDELSYLGQLIN